MPNYAAVSEEALVNTSIEGSQRFSRIEKLSNGNFVVVWFDWTGPSSAPTGGIAVRGQIYAPDGTPLGNEISLYPESNLQVGLSSLDLTALSDGGFAVTLINGRDVYVEKVSADGTSLVSYPVNDAAPGSVTVTSTTALAGGGWVTMWAEAGGVIAPSPIYAQVFNAAGNRVGAEVELDEAVTTIGSLTALADGHFLLTYTKNGADLDLWGHIYNSSLAPIGAAFQIPASSAGATSTHDVAVLGNGNVLVSWTDATAGAVFAQQFNTSGARVGSQFQVSTSAGAEQPRIAPMADGTGYVVSYWSFSSGSDVFLQAFNNAGTKIGGEVRVNQITQSTQSEPGVVVLDDGRVVVTWTDFSGSVNPGADDSSFHGIKLRLFADLSTTPTSGDDRLTGGANSDTLAGLAGNDVLDGGAGGDNLIGGTGNDIYFADRQDDVVYENPGEGTDTVIASTGYYLYGNVERLVLATGAGDIFGVGNELANMLTGNTGGNTLLGGGGADVVHGMAGVDIIYGEDGNDTLYGDAGNDVIVGGTGNDTMDGGTGGDSLYGEDGNDTLWGGTSFEFDQLVGGAGNDVLRGDSGLGDFDHLYGGTGDDAFYVDTYADLVFEQAGEGTDTVFADVNGTGYYLYANIENLILLDDTPFGVGNELANTITGSATGNYLLGGAGNDVLNGKAGNDVLFGEGGADTFVFEKGTGGDTIGDFVPGTDKIDLSAFGFDHFAQVQAAMIENGGTTAINLAKGDFIVINGVANGALSAADFVLAPASAAADDAVDFASVLRGFGAGLWHGGDAMLS